MFFLWGLIPIIGNYIKAGGVIWQKLLKLKKLKFKPPVCRKNPKAACGMLFWHGFWAFLDMLFVNKDAQGVVFSGNKELIFVLKILAAIWLLGGIYLLYANARFSYEETEILAPGQVVSVEVSE